VPYKRVGKIVYIKKGGSWKKKAAAKSIASAKKMINLLRAKKHG
tara:strand:- start:5820 stop:5951 length:132 start_codon:yes stop_codon:yes gene_type:complete